jgi:hypothetical protein
VASALLTLVFVLSVDPEDFSPCPSSNPRTDWFVAIYRVDKIAARVVVTQDVVYLRYHGARSQNWCVVPFCYCLSLSHRPNLVAICTTHARLDTSSLPFRSSQRRVHPDEPPCRAVGPKIRSISGSPGTMHSENKLAGCWRRRRKSIRDHERFLTHFGAIETLTHLSGNNDSFADGNEIVERMAYASLLSESLRPGASSTLTPARPTDTAVLSTR